MSKQPQIFNVVGDHTVNIILKLVWLTSIFLGGVYSIFSLCCKTKTNNIVIKNDKCDQKVVKIMKNVMKRNPPAGSLSQHSAV